MKGTHGPSQDPLNFLLRTVLASKTYPDTVKKHLAKTIKKVKADKVATIDKRISQYAALASYAEMVRIHELLANLDPGSIRYRTASFCWAKMTQTHRSSLARVGVRREQQEPGGAKRRAPMRGTTNRPTDSGPANADAA